MKRLYFHPLAIACVLCCSFLQYKEGVNCYCSDLVAEKIWWGENGRSFVCRVVFCTKKGIARHLLEVLAGVSKVSAVYVAHFVTCFAREHPLPGADAKYLRNQGIRFENSSLGCPSPPCWEIGGFAPWFCA